MVAASENDALPNSVPRPDWLLRHAEAALDPARPIIDAHHHLWDMLHPRYLVDDLLADGSGPARMYRFVRAGALHVREQFPGRQGFVQLRRSMERVQTHRKGTRTFYAGRVIPR